MPKVEWNKQTWDGSYDWQHRGDEWSAKWGGPFMQWYGTILPRIHRFLPASTILEVAPGYGRWTQFLKDWCDRLIGVDLSQTCVDACRERFANCSHLSFSVNDGKSLDMVDDDTIDFAFTFDSLVHADDDVLESYMTQLARKLKSHGAAFIHHSNLGAYPNVVRLESFPHVRQVLVRLGLSEQAAQHCRSPTMTAAKLQAVAMEHGLQCVSQELVTWGTRRVLLDCLSTVVKKTSPWCSDNRVFDNYLFMAEAKYLSGLSRLYGDSTPFRSAGRQEQTGPAGGGGSRVR